MANFDRNSVLNLLVGAVFTFVTLSAAGQEYFPDAKGRDAVFRACSQCHGLDRLVNVRLTSSEWENALYDMIARGAIVEKDDLSIVRNYLIESLATDKQ